MMLPEENQKEHALKVVLKKYCTMEQRKIG